jgi:hypothetical protein
MILEPNTGMSVISHSRMVQDAAELETLLKAEGLTPSPNSILSEAIEAARQLSQWKRDLTSMPHDTRAPELIPRITGLSYLARALFHARGSPTFGDLKRLLKYLDQDNPLPTEQLPRPHSARNYVFELEVACHFMAKGLKVKTASEPDVVVEHPRRWNFASKMVSSNESNAVGEHLAQARTRIDDVDHRFRGVVVIAHALAAIQQGPVLLTTTRLISRSELFGAGVLGEEEQIVRNFNDSAQVVFME